MFLPLLVAGRRHALYILKKKKKLYLVPPKLKTSNFELKVGLKNLQNKASTSSICVQYYSLLV